MDSNLALPLHRPDDKSLITFSASVKAWEGDHNGHMNVQFYVRAFQLASEMAALIATGKNPGTASAKARHYRFQKELFTADVYEVRTSRIADGSYEGAIVHRMLTGPDLQLSATAIEIPNYPSENLPGKPEAEIGKALPRGLEAEPHGWLADAFSPERQLLMTPVGTVRPSETDHTGDIQANVLLALVANASHDLHTKFGMTGAWAKENNRGRMAVEMQITRHGPVAAGEIINVVSGISEVATRKFMTRHQAINASTGEPCATMEQVLLVVDLKARKPVEVPDFIREADKRFFF